MPKYRDSAPSLEAAQAIQTKARQQAISENREQLAGGTAVLRVTKYASQLPPPDLLDLYEQQVPGLRSDIVEDWKAERAHRRGMEMLWALMRAGTTPRALLVAIINEVAWWGPQLPQK